MEFTWAYRLRPLGGEHRFHLEVALQGSGSLFFTPVGKVTEVNVRSTWSDPSFNGAYAVSAAMTIGLTSLYVRALFDSRKMAFLVGGTLVLLYGFLFTVLQLQDYALLIGSLGLFAILATVMYFSRIIDWQ